MKVRVTAPPFCDHKLIDDQGFLELAEGAKLGALYKILKVPIPIRPIMITSVNYDRSKQGRILKDGDDVSIFWPLSGG